MSRSKSIASNTGYISGESDRFDNLNSEEETDDSEEKVNRKKIIRSKKLKPIPTVVLPEHSHIGYSKKIAKVLEFEDCKICFNLMDNEAHLPRILPCGHTICEKCLTSIVKSPKSCPTCRKSTSSESIEEYPINYILLDIINSSKDLLKQEKLATIKQHQEQLHKATSKLKSIKPVAESLNFKIDSAEKMVEDLNANLEFTEGSYDVEKSLDNLKELEESVEDICSQINATDSPLMTDVLWRCKDFDSVADLLEEIRKGIINNKKFVALLRIDGITKFAKLTINDNYFCIHSFEKMEDVQDFETICFQDLLEELLKRYESIYAFFDCYHRKGSFPRKVMVQVSDSTSFLGYRFLKLCTGELGSSYKGHRYSQNYGQKMNLNLEIIDIDYIIRLKFSGWDMNGLDSYSKHFLRKEQHLITLQPNHCYLTCQIDGSPDIIRYKNQNGVQIPNVIGPIVDFNGDFASTFKNATLPNILDCGIAFKVCM